MKPEKLILEACVETFEQAQNAEKNGADRIELCGDLSVGGVTPSLALIEKSKSELTIPIMVMIRPRGGNFVYSVEELEQMKSEIIFCKKLGVKGVVFGILDNKNQINESQTRTLCELAFPMEVTFHKAIDEVEDPKSELNKLLNISNLNRVLTSGKSRTALEGAELIKEMMAASAGKLTILSAGKVTNQNLLKVHETIGGEEYHGRKIVGDLD